MDSLAAVDTIVDTPMVDKLRTIRPFTESQLLTLYSNTELEANNEFINTFIEKYSRIDDNQFYQLLLKLEKLRERQSDCRIKINDLKLSGESLQENVWQLNSKTISRPNRCADRRHVEAKHKHNEASLNEVQLKSLEKNLFWLRDTVVSENCINSYLSQFAELEIETIINDIIGENDNELKRQKLRQTIAALFSYLRRPILEDNDLVKIASNWLINLVSSLLAISSIEDHLFLLNHVLRCTAGSSLWSAHFIQCPNPLSVSDIELGSQYINHCVTVISTILSPILAREKFIGISEVTKKKNLTSDDTWHLVDPDINDGEDVTNSPLQIAETDVIRFLKQIPFNDVLKYASMIGNLNDIDISNGSTPCESTEIQMLKLLSFSTKLIQILKQGLQSFNCLRYKELTIYISSMIRRTVLCVSKLWVNCKTHFVAHDHAMILRLQVEFDHFMLRSIVTILATNRQGVYNFLSVFTFDGVSESMMWHILWVVYNNGRDETDDLGGLCPYFSATYWKNKFEEATVQYLFKEKLIPLSNSESHSLLTLLYNMAISRNIDEQQFVLTILREIFEISFQTKQLSDKMVEKGKQLIIRICLMQQSLIASLIDQLLDHETDNEKVIDLFSELPLNAWIPEDDKFNLFCEWLISHSIDSFLNQIARIIFSKLNWSVDHLTNALYMNIKRHQTLAIKIYLSLTNNLIAKNAKEMYNTNVKQFGYENLLLLAKSTTFPDFAKWCWNMLLILRLHLFERSEDEWDIIFSDRYFNFKENNAKDLLYLDVDSNMVSICRGIDEQNPFALYIALMITDLSLSTSSFEKCLDLIEKLLSNQHFIPVIRILSIFLPLHTSQCDILISRSKLMTLFSQMFVYIGGEVIGVIAHQLSKLSDEECQLKLLICWTKIIYGVIGSVLKAQSSSWSNYGSVELKQIAFICDNISMIIYRDEKLKHDYLRYLSEHPFDIQNYKLSTPGWFSSLFNWNSSTAYKKCEWITPLHIIYWQNQSNVWLGWLVSESDSLRMEKLWEDIVTEISVDHEISIELAINNVCNRCNRTSIPISILPINSWLALSMSTPTGHDLEPIIWFKFFASFFASSDSCNSIGLKFIDNEMRKKLNNRLNLLIDYHHKLWVTNDSSTRDSDVLHDELTKLFRAYILWLEDSQLHDVFVNLEPFPPQYLISLLKKAMSNECSIQFHFDYVDMKHIEVKILQFHNLWRDICAQFLESSLCFKCDDEIRLIADDEMPLVVPELKKSNLEFFDQSFDLSNNSTALLILIQHNVRDVLEEAKFFENMLHKFDDLNQSFMQYLPQLYYNMKKEVKFLVPCDKDAYDPKGCSGPAAIKIEFIEATQSQHTVKQIEKNRMDFDNTLCQLIETPSNKVVSASLIIERYIPILIKNYDFQNVEQSDVERNLLASLLVWLNDSNNLFAPSKQVFSALLDALGSISEIRRDETNMFILETAINNPKLIEYLAPRLEPGKSTTDCFLNMYQLIQERLTKVTPLISFVLLSKFDVSLWFKNSSTIQCLNLISILGDALYSFGSNPKDESQIILGLYRKHLQYAIIFCFPEYIKDVLNILLKGMRNCTITSNLWNDVLLSFGFFMTVEENIDYYNFYNECKKYSNNQPLFSANELYDILLLLSTHFYDAYQEIPLEFLEHYKTYVQRYLLFLTNISFCWTNINSRFPPCHILNVWNPFYDNWKVWLFPKRSTRFINSEDFNCVWDLFLLNIQYFIDCFQVSQIGNLFEATVRQKAWDHFTEAQQKHIDSLFKQIKGLKSDHIEEVVDKRENNDLSDNRLKAVEDEVNIDNNDSNDSAIIVDK